MTHYNRRITASTQNRVNGSKCTHMYSKHGKYKDGESQISFFLITFNSNNGSHLSVTALIKHLGFSVRWVASWLEITLNGMWENLKHVSLHFLWKEQKERVVALTSFAPSASSVTHQQTKKKAESVGKKEKKSHYKDYFPLLCGSVRMPIAFHYFINKWVCEQRQSGGSIVLKPKSWMPEAR